MQHVMSRRPKQRRRRRRQLPLIPVPLHPHRHQSTRAFPFTAGRVMMHPVLLIVKTQALMSNVMRVTMAGVWLKWRSKVAPCANWEWGVNSLKHVKCKNQSISGTFWVMQPWLRLVRRTHLTIGSLCASRRQRTTRTNRDPSVPNVARMTIASIQTDTLMEPVRRLLGPMYKPTGAALSGSRPSKNTV